MNDQMFGCSCGFMCVESQLAKTQGACPKCGVRTAANKAKYADEFTERTDLHMQARLKKVN